MKKYKIEGRTLGKGATSEVFVGMDERNQMVVIKKVKKISDADHEANILRSIPPHKHIIKILDYVIEDLNGFIVMEYHSGTRLGSIRKGKIFNAKLAVKITIKILEGLKELHQQRILHCDITPHNIIISNDDPQTVRIIDFGSAVKTNELGEYIGSHRGATKWYRPPELKKEKNVFTAHLDYTSDLYGAASICLYLLTGIAPYRKKQACRQVENKDLQKILRKATRVNKQKRYQTAQELIDALSPFI